MFSDDWVLPLFMGTQRQNVLSWVSFDMLHKILIEKVLCLSTHDNA